MNLFGGYIGGRLDLTPGQATRCRRPPGRSSGNLRRPRDDQGVRVGRAPDEAALMKRELDDLLRDLRVGRPRQDPRRPARSGQGSNAFARGAKRWASSRCSSTSSGSRSCRSSKATSAWRCSTAPATEDDPVRASHRRPGVPARRLDPVADAGQEAGASASSQRAAIEAQGRLQALGRSSASRTRSGPSRLADSTPLARRSSAR